MNYETEYTNLLIEVMALRRQLRAEQVKNTLAKLAKTDPKSQHLRDLEDKLNVELNTHNRGERIDTLLEIIQDIYENQPNQHRNTLAQVLPHH